MESSGIPSMEELRECLMDQSQPMGKRTRAAFYLRTLGTPPAVKVVGEGVCHVYCILLIAL